jgi:hypothetical protein
MMRKMLSLYHRLRPIVNLHLTWVKFKRKSQGKPTMILANHGLIPLLSRNTNKKSIRETTCLLPTKMKTFTKLQKMIKLISLKVSASLGMRMHLRTSPLWVKKKCLNRFTKNLAQSLPSATFWKTN